MRCAACTGVCSNAATCHRASPRVTALAIGIVSLLGYLPDVFLPLLNGWLTTAYPGMHGYQLYFGYVARLLLKGMLERASA